MTRQLRILHVSDLHERVALDWMDNQRKRKVRVIASSRYRVLEGSNVYDITDHLRRDRPIDLVCFTGDIADRGLEPEYVKLHIASTGFWMQRVRLASNYTWYPVITMYAATSRPRRGKNFAISPATTRRA